MKRQYVNPYCKKVEFAYKDQVVAASIPVANNLDVFEIDECTNKVADCNAIYNVATRAFWNCATQG